ncbi:hypothetical protein GCM10010238_30150 [Streptomyces griseoviridis]|uniref:Uncharacterized protein n=1 Tax=Streptomyces griseoviridis TaxID=45398 RepID=A0A918GJ69_STRGD|nr:hypothetical protein GCM10010238_30150 [Streptomyces niveoruber]
MSAAGRRGLRPAHAPAVGTPVVRLLRVRPATRATRRTRATRDPSDPRPVRARDPYDSYDSYDPCGSHRPYGLRPYGPPALARPLPCSSDDPTNAPAPPAGHPVQRPPPAPVRLTP